MRNTILTLLFSVVFVFSNSSWAETSPSIVVGDTMIADSSTIIDPNSISTCISQIDIDPAPIWGFMNDSCLDYCGKEGMACAQALTQGCDCGPDYCFSKDLNKCVPNP